MNIHLPAILGFTRYQGFDPSPYRLNKNARKKQINLIGVQKILKLSIWENYSDLTVTSLESCWMYV